MLSGRVPTDWENARRTDPKRFQTHYMFFAEGAELEYETAAGRERVPPRTLLLFPPRVVYHVRSASPDTGGVFFRFRFKLLQDETLLTPWQTPQTFPGRLRVPQLLHELQTELNVPGPHQEARKRAMLLLFSPHDVYLV